MSFALSFWNIGVIITKEDCMISEKENISFNLYFKS